MTQTANSSIDELVARIVSQFSPRSIILFGSHARGTAGPDSDVDLLVVMPVSGSKRRQALAIDLAVMEVGVPKDIIVVTPDEIETYKDVAGTVIYDAVHEGRVLYERAA